jgi:citrate lyase subunit beta/citryl-CoA lyase
VLTLDLEDGAAAADRPAARKALLDTPLGPARTVLRINAADIDDQARFLETLDSTAYTTVMMPKSESAAAVGVDATVCIHPSQVPLVRKAVQPSVEKLAWARRVLAAAQIGRGCSRSKGRWSTHRCCGTPRPSFDARAARSWVRGSINGVEIDKPT